MLRKDHTPTHTPSNQRPQTWTVAALKALAQASALGIPVALTFPSREEEGRR